MHWMVGVSMWKGLENWNRNNSTFWRELPESLMIGSGSKPPLLSNMAWVRVFFSSKICFRPQTPEHHVNVASIAQDAVAGMVGKRSAHLSDWQQVTAHLRCPPLSQSRWEGTTWPQLVWWRVLDKLGQGLARRELGRPGDYLRRDSCLSYKREVTWTPLRSQFWSLLRDVLQIHGAAGASCTVGWPESVVLFLLSPVFLQIPCRACSYICRQWGEREWEEACLASL